MAGLTLIDEYTRKCLAICLNGEIFWSLQEARVVIEHWRVQYNTVRRTIA
jgi:hypothetical protein